MASALAGKPAAFVNADVALGGDTVVGSFTVDGLTFAVTGESSVELVGIAPSVIPSEAAGVEGFDSDQASEAGVTNLTLPETVTYESADYTVTSIGAYAFYLSGLTSITLPASVSDVDDRAFRSSDVASVTLADENSSFSSYDGALYDATRSSLLLISGGRQGAVRISDKAEEVDASAFSHCAGVDSISVDAGSAHLSSWEGLLYDADGTTLLRVPAGATEITIREGCTTIAAGALEACAKLATINAPASVTSISPDIFHAIPTVSLPAASVILGESGEATGAEGSNEGHASEANAQLTAMVALSSADDDLPEASPSTIVVSVPEDGDGAPWKALGFSVEDLITPEATMESGEAYTAKNLYENDGVNLCWPTDIRYNTHTTLGDRVQNVTPDEWVGLSNSVTYYRFYQGAFWTAHSKQTELNRWGLNENRTGVTKVEVGPSPTELSPLVESSTLIPLEGVLYVSVDGARERHTVAWDAGYAEGESQVDEVEYGRTTIAPQVERAGCEFLGWSSSHDMADMVYGDRERTKPIYEDKVYYACWRFADCDLGFDVDSEPGDEDYPGVDKPEQTITGEQIENGHHVEIEDPKRPGYVFQGWTIPDASGTHGNLSSLVYEGEDGKWYVDASKLPDYAGEDGRVELTARWTSVISVDVPSSVTFYADVVTQGNESREGLASGAFGQSKVQSLSEVDLRIVGLESEPVRGNGTTSLGATDLIKSKDGKPVSTTVDMLFSVYPVEKAPSEGDLKDPGRKSEKPEGAASFALDDILLEKEFASADFSIPAGKSLSLGYRLNLQEAGAVLDYDKLSTLSEGTSASIANISYCFAADAIPSDWGEPFWFENRDEGLGRTGYHCLNDIKAAADDLSAHASDPAQSEHYKLYSSLVGTGTFHLKVDGRYLDVQLLGICQDTKTSGGKAGLTFQTKDIYAHSGIRSSAAGGGEFPCQMNPAGSKSDGWASSAMNDALRSIFWGYLPEEVRAAVVGVDKFQQLYGDATGSYLQKTSDETIWLPSMYEVFGTTFTYYNDSEGIPVDGYIPFQYQAYAGNGGSEANAKAVKTYNGSASRWWLRSALRDNAEQFCIAYSDGYRGGNPASDTRGVAPCFCL